jgi:hypothetical protein
MEVLWHIFQEHTGNLISYKIRMDFVKKPLVATMSEVPLHLAPPVQ